MSFTFDPTKTTTQPKIKCPKVIAHYLLSKHPVTSGPLVNKLYFYILSVTPQAITFEVNVNFMRGPKVTRTRTVVLFKEQITYSLERIKLFDTVVTNAQHGGSAAEMTLKFLAKTLNQSE